MNNYARLMMIIGVAAAVLTVMKQKIKGQDSIIIIINISSIN